MSRVDSREVEQRIPITLLSGFLGAGKTTLINHLLSDPNAGKIAVIVNEFGEIGIDGDLISRASEDMLELTNGCICCAAQGDLMDGLNKLFLRKVGLAEPKIEFDKIVIETTGIADPSPLAKLLYTDLKLDLTFKLDAVLTVVDLKHVESEIANSIEAQKQIAIADKIIFNKRDMVDDAEFARATAVVGALNPYSRKEVTSFGVLAVDKIVDLDLFDPKNRDDAVGEWLGNTDAEADHHHDHTPDVSAVCLRESRVMDWSLVLRFFVELTEQLGDDLYRVKGLVQFDNVDKPVILQGVQDTFSPPTYAETWPRGKPETRIVVIGKGLNREELETRFATCILKEPTVLDRGSGAI
ncbi:MAG: putative GTP-binding protein YjiA [Alphaproteobacteria bacterium MarineAlpha10_Bin2]|nr:MAG: putative GTP-binding protein YjiA [Alphaproteobacteria bacterium MarineAlpha10_Bin2]